MADDDANAMIELTEHWLPISVGVILAAILQLVLWTRHHNHQKSRIPIVKVLLAHWTLWLARIFVAATIFQAAKLVELFLEWRKSSGLFDNLQSLQSLLACGLLSWCLFNFHNWLRRFDAKTGDQLKLSIFPNVSGFPNVSDFACLQQQLSKHKKWF